MAKPSIRQRGSAPRSARVHELGEVLHEEGSGKSLRCACEVSLI